MRGKRRTKKQEKESRQPSGEGKTVQRVVPPRYKGHIRPVDNEAVPALVVKFSSQERENSVPNGDLLLAESVLQVVVVVVRAILREIKVSSTDILRACPPPKVRIY